MKTIPLLIALLLTTTACQSSRRSIEFNPKLPTGTDEYAFKNSEHFKGFTYDQLSQALTVIDLAGKSTTHYHVPASVAKGFISDGGHLGYYQQSIADRYPSQDKVEVEGRQFLPVPSTVFMGVAYDVAERRLFLLRQNDSVVEYINVPPEIYRGFLEAPVKGSYYKGYIENIYETTKAVKADMMVE